MDGSRTAPRNRAIVATFGERFRYILALCERTFA